ncbi:MAG: flippase [Candidatus Pacearchaeota archaeon]
MQEEKEIQPIISEKSSLTKIVLKNSFWNFLTSIITRFGALIFTIIIARILQPELFGLYSLALSVMFLIMTFTDLGINTALVKYLSDAFKKDNKKAVGYFNYFLRIKLTLTLILFAILLVIAYPLSNYIFNKPSLFFPLLLCAIYMIFYTFVGFYESIFYVIQKVKYVTINEVIYQILRIFLAILGIYLITNKVVGTIAGLIFASIVALGIIIYFSHKYYFSIIEKTSQLSKNEKKEIFKFLFYTTIGSITGVFFSYIDIILLGIFVRSEFIGYYKAAFGIVGALTGFISITNVLLPLFVQLKGERLENAFNKIFRYSVILALPITFGLLLIAKPFIIIIYGSSYLQAVIPLYVISFLMVEYTLSPMVSWLFAAKGKPQITAKLLMISTIMNIILNILFILYLIRISETAAVLGVAIATLISRYFYFIILIKKTKKNIGIKIKLNSVVKPLIASIIMFVSLLIFQLLTHFTWPFSIIEIFYAAIVYFIAIIALKGIGKQDLELIKKVLK